MKYLNLNPRLIVCFNMILLLLVLNCKKSINEKDVNLISNQELPAQAFTSTPNEFIISRIDYEKKLYGFWLGQCIANWTGLVTEMDKIGNIGAIKTGDFYTRADWGGPDQSSIWGEGVPSDLSDTIDFVLRDSSEVWGADDDTDIEYMYQHLLLVNRTSLLTPEMIKEGWLKHIKSEEENFLWVSNQRAFDLMKEGVLPPDTGRPENNEHFEMIDAQLTTELFGLFAPTRPDFALKMADLPIRTVASENALWISQFYVVMHALAARVDPSMPTDKQTIWLSKEARNILPNHSYAAKMFDYVERKYHSKIPWEQTRDSIYKRYQVDQKDGYNITAQELYCNGCFAAGINFAAGLVSWFYGEGDFKETIKIGALCGWDSDNPTATWGGLLGFIYGKDYIENLFDIPLSDKFNIHRTRQNFGKDSIDTFNNMAQKGLFIIDSVVIEELNGTMNIKEGYWRIPKVSQSIPSVNN
ncbi:ADP-ribosylglycohydrolase family protein [Algibacter mikhailovii]|uniref:ADP-ribosylglycohydrolase family protein n=1 Tax=Algibacter mikhailovii TaxID=425498 RepID=UPI0024943446|nr:ADP-ribosylglycohydrolase family protein [Algibacter mikhailovii]